MGWNSVWPASIDSGIPISYILRHCAGLPMPLVFAGRMEYVVISALSVETLKQTHGRYFWGEYEVLHPVEISYGASRYDGRPLGRSESIAAAAPDAADAAIVADAVAVS